jgi:hypothetical protein
MVWFMPNEYRTRDRHVDISRPNHSRLLLHPKRHYFGILCFLLALAVCGPIVVLFGVSDEEMAIAALFGGRCLSALPFLTLLLVYLAIPRFAFDRSNGNLIYGRLGLREKLPLEQIVAVQCCFGGIHGSRSPYDTYQLNLVLQGGSRLNLAHHSDSSWIQSTGRQIADFLTIPLVDLGKDSERPKAGR